MKNPPPQKESKAGLTWGGPVVGAVKVERGFNCQVRGGILTFDDNGMTEDEATANARTKCKKMLPTSSCDRTGCRPIQ
jgi:hypothetical protein